MRLLSILCIAAFLITPAAGIGADQQLDPLSAACIDCHDGSGALHVRFCLIGQKGEGCGGHIISASYADLAAKDESLIPEGKLPPEIVLHQGKITCVTCHGDDPHQGESLVMDNRSSALCRACHLK